MVRLNLTVPEEIALRGCFRAFAGPFMVSVHDSRVSERNRFNDKRLGRAREMHIEERSYDPEK